MHNSRFSCVSLMLAMLLLTAVTQAQTPAVTLVPEITTLAGDGTAGYSGTELNDPAGVAVDSVGNLYFADQGNDRIRKVNAVTGEITTVAGNGTFGHSGDGGAATSAELYSPKGIALGGGGNFYIADYSNHRIRKVNGTTGVITTVAGDGTGGYSGDGGKATSAELHFPNGVALDSSGNLYIADYNNQRIRKVNAATGIITTVAGNGTAGYSGDGGAATSAKLDGPANVVVDLAGNLYIADSHNDRIRKVSAASGVISTVAGGGSGCAGQSDSVGDGCSADSAELNLPQYVVVDSASNLYISDSQNERIRKVSAATGVIATVAGDGTSGYSGDTGPATSAELHEPFGVAADSSGNLYIADSLNNRIRKTSGTASPVIFRETEVGSASASQKVLLRINSALKITSISVPESQGGKQEFTVGTIAGCVANGATTEAAGSLCTVPVTFHPGYPGWRQVPLVMQTSAGTFNFGLAGLGQGPQPALLPGVITTVAGNGTFGDSGDGGPATSAEMSDPTIVALDSAGNLYIADFGGYILKVSAATGVITTVAGNGTPGYSGDGGPATSAELNGPYGVALDSAGNLYIADFDNNVIREVSAATGIITTVAGNGTPGYSGDHGPATSAELSGSCSLRLDSAGNLYIVDAFNNRIRKVNAATGVITTVAGNGNAGYSGDGGPATSAELDFPQDLAIDPGGNLYIADYFNNRIRKVSATTGVITTVAGDGKEGYSGNGGPATSAEFVGPTGLGVDSAGNLYIADYDGSSGAVSAIRKVSSATGVITTVAGNGNSGHSGDGGAATSAELNTPSGVALDSAGNLYIADSSNYRVRKVSVSTPPLSFSNTHVGSSSSAKTFTLANIGNAALKLSGITVSTNFKTEGSATTCSTSSAVAAGNSCEVGVVFSPTSTGTHNGTLTLTDNALNVTGTTQHVTLSGTGE